nr:hypothetical protein [Acetobacter persici]
MQKRLRGLLQITRQSAVCQRNMAVRLRKSLKSGIGCGVMEGGKHGQHGVSL